MKRDKVFMFRVTRDERLMITALAHKLQRTQSDVVRFIVVNAARSLFENSNDFQSQDARLTNKNLNNY